MLSNTLLPIIIIIFSGFIIKQKRWLSEDFWSASDMLCYNLFLPALIIEKLAFMQLDEVSIFKLMLSVIIVLFMMTMALVVIQKLKPIPAATFTSVYQGSIRFNTFMVLTIVMGIWGVDSSEANIAIIMAGLMIFIINILCVGIFSIYVQKQTSFVDKVLMMTKNPLILSCILGASLNFLSLELPEFVYASLALFGKVALTLGLMSVGAGLIIKFNDWVSYPVVLSVLAKLLIMPLLALTVGFLLKLDNVSHQVLVIMFSVPTAISSYILASQLGGDVRAMAKIITIQTLISSVSLFLILLWIARQI